MSIENCKNCGNLFQKTIKDICPTCVLKEDEAYKKVRIYLKRHRAVEMNEVSKETGVALELIFKFLQEGRIVLGAGSATTYPCQQCGAPIQTGSLCSNCLSERSDMQRSLQSAANEIANEAPVLEQKKKVAFHARD